MEIYNRLGGLTEFKKLFTMNIISKVITWVKLKIQTMINRSQYDTRKNRTLEILTQIMRYFIDGGSAVDDIEIESLKSYFDKENVTLDKKSMELRYSVGDYRFIVQAKILGSNEKVSSVINTFEEIFHYDRLGSDGKKIIKKINNLEITTDSGGAIKGFGNGHFLENYCTRLIAYIDSIENTKKPGGSVSTDYIILQ